MCFNRMLNRTGHFWEKRYHCVSFPRNDRRRVLNTLRYIHANPKAANMQRGFFYDFSNYGSYERLTQDGLTQWHPVFLSLGNTLESCAAIYRSFCLKYRPKPKTERYNSWGSQLLKNLKLSKQLRKRSPGQKSLWSVWAEPNQAIQQVTERFVLANCFDPKIACLQFRMAVTDSS